MKIPTCRQALKNIANEYDPEHAGLALTRYLVEQDDTNEAIKDLYNRVTNVVSSDGYRNAFARWEQVLTRRANCVAFRGELASPLAIGLGNESPTEVGLTVHHTYGTPVIPGSALKGMCRRTALKLLGEEKITNDQFNVLFGDMKQASKFVFYDAWYDYKTAERKPFHRDTITVHHQKYYGSGGKDESWPTDFDDPNPVSFLVIKPKAIFLFAMDVPTGWEDFAKNLLQWSLKELGVGGKTNAGYGYFKEFTDIPKPPPPPKEVTWENVTLKLTNSSHLSLTLTGDLKGKSETVNVEKPKSEEIRKQFGNDWEQIKKKKQRSGLTFLVEVSEKEIKVLKVILPEGNNV